MLSQFSSGLRLSQVRRLNARSAAAIMTAAIPKPELTFGVISDIQYADIPDGVSFHGVPRYYRASKYGVQRAVAAWQQQPIEFAIHLGDILDGKQPKDTSQAALDGILEDLNALGRPMYHLIGNHCLYNLPREVLNSRFSIPSGVDGSSYYSFIPHPAYRMVVLDSFHVSALGWPQDHPLTQEAAAILAANNPNKDQNSPEGLEGLNRRFVKFGGGAGTEQLRWLKDQLAHAASQQQQVIVFSHLPLHPDTCPPVCLLWDHAQVLQLLHDAGNVVATFAGHTHAHGYHQDAHSIHHVVLAAVLETPPGRDCYGQVHVFPDRLELEGVDVMPSMVMPRGDILHTRLPAGLVPQ